MVHQRGYLVDGSLGTLPRGSRSVRLRRTTDVDQGPEVDLGRHEPGVTGSDPRFPDPDSLPLDPRVWEEGRRNDGSGSFHKLETHRDQSK